MALRTKEHITGGRAQAVIAENFECTGYACNEIRQDYGEDFFVVTHEEASGIVEPFRLFIQAKGTALDSLSDTIWTEHINVLTVRNWVLANEMVVVVKRHNDTGEKRYCIPEEVVDYFDIVNIVAERGPKATIGLKCNLAFSDLSPKQLVDRARIRHYERLVRLQIPDEDMYQGYTRADLFVLEFMGRLGLIEDRLPSEATMWHYDEMIPSESYKDDEDFTAENKIVFEKSVRIIHARISEIASDYQVSNAFLERCGVILATLISRQYEP